MYTYLVSIYKFSLSGCLLVCLYPIDRAQIFGETSRDPMEGLWVIQFSKISLHQNSIFENLENPRNFL